MNTFVLIVGNPRTSKSYFALKMAEIYSKENNIDFDVNEQLTFDDIKKFLMWSSHAKNSIFILDETGTTLSGELFWSLQQRIMRRFVQTQGFRKNVLVWVLPSICMLQKSFRFLSNYAVKTIKQGLVEVYKIKVDQLLGKGYPDRVETIEFSVANKNTIAIYEKMKCEWNDASLTDDIDFIKQLEKPQFRKLAPTYYIDAFRNQTIDKNILKENMTQLNFHEQDIDLIVANENKKILEKIDKERMKETKQDFSKVVAQEFTRPNWV